MRHARQHPGTILPPGLVATKSWLMGSGVHRHTLDNWIKSGQLVAVARGVYKRPESMLSWQGVACSLQRMGFELTPGGLTSLELQGFAHHLPFGDQAVVHLYGRTLLPDWLGAVLPGVAFRRHGALRLDSAGENAGFSSALWRTMPQAFGNEQLQLRFSSPELAMLEVLMDVPKLVSFEHADSLLQGLPMMSPQKLNQILVHCNNVKAKRLFLWLGERNQSPWMKKLDLERFRLESGTLGTGKRVVAPGGKLDRKYLITVPAEMAARSDG